MADKAHRPGRRTRIQRGLTVSRSVMYAVTDGSSIADTLRGIHDEQYRREKMLFVGGRP